MSLCFDVVGFFFRNFATYLQVVLRLKNKFLRFKFEEREERSNLGMLKLVMHDFLKGLHDVVFIFVHHTISLFYCSLEQNNFSGWNLKKFLSQKAHCINQCFQLSSFLQKSAIFVFGRNFCT